MRRSCSWMSLNLNRLGLDLFIDRDPTPTYTHYEANVERAIISKSTHQHEPRTTQRSTPEVCPISECACKPMHNDLINAYYHHPPVPWLTAAAASSHFADRLTSGNLATSQTEHWYHWYHRDFHGSSGFGSQQGQCCSGSMVVVKQVMFHHVPLNYFVFLALDSRQVPELQQ
jgi:hypothetical protein